jgi:hypothetical protein
MRMRMTRKMVRSGVIPIRNSQFARNNYVPFCSFLFLCGLSCLNAGPRFGSQRVANSRGTRVLSRVFTNAARSLAPNLGLGERSFGVVRDPYWSGGLGWTASCHNSQRSARPDRLANVGAASFSPRAADWENPRSAASPLPVGRSHAVSMAQVGKRRVFLRNTKCGC